MRQAFQLDCHCNPNALDMPRSSKGSQLENLFAYTYTGCRLTPDFIHHVNYTKTSTY